MSATRSFDPHSLTDPFCLLQDDGDFTDGSKQGLYEEDDDENNWCSDDDWRNDGNEPTTQRPAPEDHIEGAVNGQEGDGPEI